MIVRSLPAFDAEQGVGLDVFLLRCLRNRLFRLARQRVSHRRRNQHETLHEGALPPSAPLDPRRDEAVADLLDQLMAHPERSALNDREAQLLREMVNDPSRTRKQLADLCGLRFGCTVSQLKRSMLAKVREHFDNAIAEIRP